MKYKKVKTPRGWVVVIQLMRDQFMEVFHNGYVDYGSDDRCSLNEICEDAKYGHLHSQQRGSDRIDEQKVEREIKLREEHLVGLKSELGKCKHVLETMSKQVHDFEWNILRLKRTDRAEEEEINT